MRSLILKDPATIRTLSPLREQLVAALADRTDCIEVAADTQLDTAAMQLLLSALRSARAQGHPMTLQFHSGSQAADLCERLALTQIPEIALLPASSNQDPACPKPF